MSTFLIVLFFLGGGETPRVTYFLKSYNLPYPHYVTTDIKKIMYKMGAVLCVGDVCHFFDFYHYAVHWHHHLHVYYSHTYQQKYIFECDLDGVYFFFSPEYLPTVFLIRGIRFL